MPFKSDKQRKYLFANKLDVAKEFASKENGKKQKKKPSKKKKKRNDKV